MKNTYTNKLINAYVVLITILYILKWNDVNELENQLRECETIRYELSISIDSLENELEHSKIYYNQTNEDAHSEWKTKHGKSVQW